MKACAPRVLVVDDDASLRRVVEYTLQEDGFDVQSVPSAEQAVKLLKDAAFDVVVTDVRMSGKSGVDLLETVRRKDLTTPVLLMTAYATVELAVEAMRKGAFDYLAKPFPREVLTTAVRRALRMSSLEAENARLRADRDSGQRMVGESQVMKELVETLRRAARTNSIVLITGESGTGKELAARAIHDWSARAEGPWVPVNCGAIPRDLVESELFGHMRGSFTGAVRDREGKFELANGGTLFLDEVGDIEPSNQVKLLRALQERTIERVGDTRTREVDVRVVAATNGDLQKAVAEGKMRLDLFYRLSVITVRIPPLRERVEDVPALVHHFIKRFAPSEDISVEPEVIIELSRRDWRGNVRELSNVLERAVALRRGNVLTLHDIGGASPIESSSAVHLPADGVALDDIVRDAVVQALERSGGNQSQAARLLRVPRHILLYRMQKLGIGAPDGPDPKGPGDSEPGEL